MAFDSAADLIFNIGANSDDAETNITRFRALLGTDLDQISAQFTDWSDKVFGELNTVKGAMLGITGAVLAAGVAIAAFAVEASKKFEEYTLAVAKAATMTGLSIEQMSKLRFTADELNVDFDRLVQGIIRFETSIFKANEGSASQAQAFARLGITQKDVAAGEQNLLPLLEKVADRFHNLKDGTEKTAMARELFSRGGAELIKMLNLGSEGLERFFEEAKKVGLVLTDVDVIAALKYQAALKTLKAEQEALNKTIFESTIAYTTYWEAWKAGFEEMVVTPDQWENFILAPFQNAQKIMAEIKKNMDLAKRDAGSEKGLLGLPAAPKIKEAATEFHGLSEVLAEVKTGLAGVAGEGAKVEDTVNKFYAKMDLASTALKKLKDEGKITAETYRTETLALAGLPGAIEEYALNKWLEIMGKEVAADEAKNAAIVEAGKSLADKIAEQTDMTYERQVAGVHKEIDTMRAEMVTKGALTAANETLLGDFEQARINRIGRLQTDAFLKEMEAAQQHLGKILEANMTAEDKLKLQYEMDVQAYGAAQLAKAKIGQGPGEQKALEDQYALNIDALTKRLSTDLQVLYNSQGWQGVFGDKFTEMLKNNPALMKQWQSSTNQSLLLVQASLESMKEMSQKAFESMATGMGGGIANALVYSKSIGQAMRAATTATLESIAAQAATQAIYSTAWGFYDLAVGNYPGADAAFEAAALFGAVTLAAGVAGRAIAPASGGGTGGGAGAGGGGRNPSASYGGSGGGSGGGQGQMGGQGGGYVQINIAGHVIGTSGIEEIAGMLSDAVQNRDVRLVATQARQGTLATF
jgi:hypothetical protein